MLPDKIEVTKSISNIIKSKRVEKKLSGAKLSQSINQASSYISALENGRIKQLSQDIFKSIIKVLYDIDDDEKITSKLEEVVSLSENPVDLIHDSEPLSEENNLEKKVNIQTINQYKTFDKKSRKDKINDFTNFFRKILNLIQTKNPELVNRLLNIIPRNFQFDVGLTLAVYEAPFFVFKNLSHEERQAYLDEFADLFNKYALISKSKESSNEAEKSPDHESTQTTSD